MYGFIINKNDDDVKINSIEVFEFYQNIYFSDVVNKVLFIFAKEKFIPLISKGRSIDSYNYYKCKDKQELYERLISLTFNSSFNNEIKLWL